MVIDGIRNKEKEVDPTEIK